MKISEMPYERLDKEKTVEELRRFAVRMQGAKDGKEAKAIRDEYIGFVSHINTVATLANIRFTQDSRDEFYKGEREYYDSAVPEIGAASVPFMKALLRDGLRADAEKYINPLVMKSYECAVITSDERILNELKEENAITTEYSALMAETLFEFRGEKMPLPKLRGFMQSGDRETRKEAYFALGKTLETVGDKLDDIFDRLVKVRDRMAKKLGFKSFTELGYYRMNRIGYGRADVEAFRKNVTGDIVPCVNALRRITAADQGIEEMKLYDNDVFVQGGNPDPVLSPEDMFAAAKKMYADLDADTGEFFEKMLEADAFDVMSREGKWGGGYCTSLPDYKQAFILANFNGTEGDVTVLTHEAGHAFADYMMYKNGNDLELNVGGMETAETHSMSMELFCQKYNSAFFGDGAKKAEYCHLVGDLTFIPYGTMVDHFQHIVYDDPTLTPAERNAEWKRLEGIYRPYMNADGIPYLEKGTRWQYQMHIYESPFYYIDYCLAQTMALQFYIESKKDYGKAFAAYKKFLCKSGTETFGALASAAGLKSPFGAGNLKEVAEKSLEAIEKLR